MSFYADTSFLFSCYVTDALTPRADAWRLANPMPLLFTEFNALEMQNALSLAVFQGRMDVGQALAALDKVQIDRRAERLVDVTLHWSDVFREGKKLAAIFSPSLGTRSLDVLHVSAALICGATNFLTFDDRQRNLAIRAGLNVLP